MELFINELMELKVEEKIILDPFVDDCMHIIDYEVKEKAFREEQFFGTFSNFATKETCL